MKEVLRLEMAIKKNDDGANVKFRCGINKVIEEAETQKFKDTSVIIDVNPNNMV